MLVVLSFMPYNQGDTMMYHAIALFSITYVMLMVECRIGPIITSICSLISVIFAHPFVYRIDRTPGLVFKAIFALLCTYTICLAGSIQATYIATIRGKMRKLMLENFTLFNKMHEGLIVLSEHDHRI